MLHLNKMTTHAYNISRRDYHSGSCHRWIGANAKKGSLVRGPFCFTGAHALVVCQFSLRSFNLSAGIVAPIRFAQNARFAEIRGDVAKRRCLALLGFGRHTPPNLIPEPYESGLSTD